jgi:hypothetical protein
VRRFVLKSVSYLVFSGAALRGYNLIADLFFLRDFLHRAGKAQENPDF